VRSRQNPLLFRGWILCRCDELFNGVRLARERSRIGEHGARALSFASDPVSVDLRRELTSGSARMSEAVPDPDFGLERDVIVRALREAQGDTAEAARCLGIGNPALKRRLMFHGLEF
jgi:hypothetical protein